MPACPPGMDPGAGSVHTGLHPGRAGSVKYDEVLAAVRENSDVADNDQAERATRATLELLGQRLSGGEPTDLASQLPGELQDTLAAHTGQAERFDVEEFLQRLAHREGGAKHRGRFRGRRRARRRTKPAPQRLRAALRALLPELR